MMMYCVNNVKLFTKNVIEVLETENMRALVETMLFETIERLVASHTSADNNAEWNLKGIEDYIRANLLPEGSAKNLSFEGLTSSEEIVEKIKEEVITLYNEKEEEHDSRTHA